MSTHPVVVPASGVKPFTRLAQIAYGALFAVVLPLLLFTWATRLDRLIELPVLGEVWLGVALAATGMVLMVAATVALRTRGGGWPMSPFPPARRVTAAAYALLDHPIYAGACLLVAGAAIAFHSGAGLWIVTPVFALACMAFVIGYEHAATAEHFGPRPSSAILRLPAATDAAPELADRLSIYILVFLPWLLAYEGVNALGVAGDALRLDTRWDRALPVLGWTEPAYFLAYPFLLRRRRHGLSRVPCRLDVHRRGGVLTDAAGTARRLVDRGRGGRGQLGDDRDARARRHRRRPDCSRVRPDCRPHLARHRSRCRADRRIVA
jgi:protein-S-isoprenylcysteine O-methyltransferase Ste14